MVARRLIAKLASTLAVLLLVSLAVFAALRLTPGDPALLLIGPQAGRADIQDRLEHLREEMGLNRPVPEQYIIWLKNVASGDLGESNRSGIPVWQIIIDRLPRTALLLGAGFVVSVPSAIVLGTLGAYYRYGWLDRFVVRFISTVFLGMPAWWFGLVLLIVFSVTLGWLPVSGYVSPFESLGEFFRHIALPTVAVSSYLIPTLTRFVYSETVDVLRESYIVAARGMGHGETSVVLRHTLRNSLGPTVTVIGYEMGALIGGVVLVEQVFGWSGLGLTLVQSVLGHDYQVVQGIVVVATIAIVLFNVGAETIVGWLDPRNRRGSDV